LKYVAHRGELLGRCSVRDDQQHARRNLDVGPHRGAGAALEAWRQVLRDVGRNRSELVTPIQRHEPSNLQSGARRTTMSTAFDSRLAGMQNYDHRT
jgi:hypothetical protein